MDTTAIRKPFHRKIRQSLLLDKIGIIWMALGVTLAVSGENTLLTLVAFILVPFFFRVLWNPGEYPVLIFIVCMQWLQTVMNVFHANTLGMSVSQLFGTNAIEIAIWYSMAGLVALVIGIRIGMGSGKAKLVSPQKLNDYSLRKLWLFYLLAWFIGIGIKVVMLALPQVTQILLPLSNIRWVIYILLATCVLMRKSGYQLLLLATALEILIGYTGFFSSYKTVFFILFIVYLAVRPKVRRREVFNATILLLLVIILALFWTSIKQDYRDYLNRDTGQQVVERTLSERFSWVGDAVLDIEPEHLGEAVEALVNRIEYTKFFAHTIMWVPSRVPHQYGSLWGVAVQHVLMPRLFFPDKPRLLSDSELTMRFTGLRLASDNEGASIGIGYMGESYIDFGFPGMLIPIFILGMIYGLIYRYFCSRESGDGIASSLAVVCIVWFYLLEMHNVKLLGGLLMSFIVYALLLKFGIYSFKPLLTRSRKTVV